MYRRQFLHTAAAGAGSLIPGPLRAQNTPGNKLNIALIGVWGRGLAHYEAILPENVVALCDVNENRLREAGQKWPQAKTYVDWRKCLDQKDIEAVIICTTDHTHAFIANWALNRGHHVYCEKPLGITVEEVRTVRANYVKRRNKVATQHGTQRHAIPNFNRVRELILDGAVGDLKSVAVWGNRQLRRPGYLPVEGTPPSHLNYDLWIGPSEYHPYNPGYFSGSAGANCLQWNMYWDFGVGQIGDMGAHTMDLAWNAIDAGLPVAAQADMRLSEKFNPDVTPVELEATFDHPANAWRPAIRVTWYQGGVMPESPKPSIDLKKIGHGVMFEGSRGWLIADFNSRMLIPSDKEGDLSYYKRRGSADLLPNMGGASAKGSSVFQREWIDACKGSLKTSCDFVYGGDLIEQMLLGLVAYRAGKRIEYDPAAGRVTNAPEANAFLRRKYRPGWTPNG
ncbi:MAG: Gfo/Idh/MocA family protein [Bryobacteraceae bacterium]